MYKQILQDNDKKTNHPIRKSTKDLDRLVIKDALQMVNKHMNRYATPQIIKKKCNLKPREASLITNTKKIFNTKCWQGCEVTKTPIHC